jgi:protein-ribulosamine 3-kinase
MRQRLETITAVFDCAGLNSNTMLPAIVKEKISHTLSISISSFISVGGGCINHGGKLVTSTGNYFVKWNDANAFPSMFMAEADGLALLGNQKVIDVAKVILTESAENFQFIVIEWIEASHNSKTYWQTLGSQLASLHRKTSDGFGLDRDNYIGSLKQINTRKSNWMDFFVENRLDVQLRLAVDQQKLDNNTVAKFNSLYKKLNRILPEEKPSLLHGDLWSGNLITNANGDPCLIDPAVYYGHREAEIAFTKLFGGFQHSFYDSYNSEFPLQPSFESRVDIYNLYPLLVHVNLFGGGYVGQVENILDHFS